MNKVTGIVTLLSVYAIVAAYKDVDDSLDVEALGKDIPRFQQYIDCFIDRKPCTAQMKAYKGHFLEAIFDGCKECNNVEKHMLKSFLKSLKNIAKTDVDEFKRKFDPNGHMDTTFADIARF